MTYSENQEIVNLLNEFNLKKGNYALARQMYMQDQQLFLHSTKRDPKMLERMKQAGDILYQDVFPAILKNDEARRLKLTTDPELLLGSMFVSLASSLTYIFTGNLVAVSVAGATGVLAATIASKNLFCFLKSEKRYRLNSLAYMELNRLSYSPKFITDFLKLNDMSASISPFGGITIEYDKDQFKLKSPLRSFSSEKQIAKRLNDETEY